MTAAPPDTLSLERLPTPIGEALVVVDERGVLRAFNWRDFEDSMSAWLARRYPAAQRREARLPVSIRAALEAYFAGDPGTLDGLAWRGAGTAFQLKVWEALCTIPVGETLSYAGLAARIGRPSAMRAVGLANGANPISVVVPCHRVIGADGSLTGYGGGLARKQWLLTHEGASFKVKLAA
ncbi:MAG TPA: methylated-DNA--[protein]-cysteine S-methyltransferase [Phenylobacterium sp.]|uniref:methylated-DNA--[protein]-cysteine S-methyltransferase n=1 Tax=Phenylobacterium sp. TaxID=1871053 RepID=UPI002B7B5402|nr:methylated-DNA--[protein]-cysteine S-methyltransferase [Phenylobacterium sp.]HSV02581.1 methylated-DNA--[protein]-cysteine S-methyltransferase [Phenylobacterium sp.]